MNKNTKLKIFNLLGVCLLMCLSFSGCNVKGNSSSENINASNFDLSIATSKNVFAIDDEIPIDISLKNESSLDIEIAYFFLITPIIPTATNYPTATEMPEEPYLKQFNRKDVIILKDDLGGYFETGLHEVKYKAQFYVNWGRENEQIIEIWSNTIQIEIAK